jgi:hypothetical protein
MINNHPLLIRIIALITPILFILTLLSGLSPFISEISVQAAPGDIDPAFNFGTGFDNNGVFDIVEQNDGKLIVGGDFENYNGSVATKIARLNTDGSLDTTFVTGTGFDAEVYSIVQQTDGKLIFGGVFY